MIASSSAMLTRRVGFFVFACIVSLSLATIVFCILRGDGKEEIQSESEKQRRANGANTLHPDPICNKAHWQERRKKAAEDIAGTGEIVENAKKKSGENYHIYQDSVYTQEQWEELLRNQREESARLEEMMENARKESEEIWKMGEGSREADRVAAEWRNKVGDQKSVALIKEFFLNNWDSPYPEVKKFILRSVIRVMMESDPGPLSQLERDEMIKLSDMVLDFLARIIYEHVPQASSLQSPASTASKMLAVHARQSVATCRRFVNNAG